VAEDGGQLFVNPKSTLGVGSLYREVERIRRTYSDMQGERANKLSILPNYKAWCRLIYDPASRTIENEDPSLKQHLIRTVMLDSSRTKIKREEMANRVKKNSQKLGKPKDMVEHEIEERAAGRPLGDEPSSQEKKKPKSS
jgi:hypothetical protein